MNIKRPVFIFYLLLSFPIFCIAQENALKSILQENLRRHLTFIASDSLQGRSIKTEFPGSTITADYLKKTVQEKGLKPGFPGYSQKVEILRKELDLDGIYIQMNNENGIGIFRSNEIISLDNPLKSVKIKGEAVFAGFGWADPVTGYDDFAGIDVKDKIVFIAEGNPDFYKKGNKQADRNLENGKKKGHFAPVRKQWFRFHFHKTKIIRLATC